MTCLQRGQRPLAVALPCALGRGQALVVHGAWVGAGQEKKVHDLSLVLFGSSMQRGACRAECAELYATCH